MARRGAGKFTLPIVIGLIAIPLNIAMLVGWILVVYYAGQAGASAAGATWLLVLGIISMSFILIFLVLLVFMLVREMREVRRHVRFIDSVTHELKTPLASLKLLLETQARAGVSDEQAIDMRRMMASDVDRLMGFIDDLLRAGQGPTDGHENVADFALHGVVERCVARVVQRHGVDSTGIRNDVTPDLRLVTDRGVVEAIVTNLVDNAIKYSDPPLDIIIRVVDDPTHLVFEVTDRGIGLSRWDRRRVFKRFFRVGSDRVNSASGTGLGLFVVNGLVRQLDGRIDAFSAGLGLGTTMRVALPRARVIREAGRAA